jgi:hypothetical protein
MKLSFGLFSGVDYLSMIRIPVIKMFCFKLWKYPPKKVTDWSVTAMVNVDRSKCRFCHRRRAPDKEAVCLRWKSTRFRSVSPESGEPTTLICLYLGALPESMPNNPNNSREVFTVKNQYRVPCQ